MRDIEQWRETKNHTDVLGKEAIPKLEVEKEASFSLEVVKDAKQKGEAKQNWEVEKDAESDLQNCKSPERRKNIELGNI